MQSCYSSLRAHTAPAAQAPASFNTLVNHVLKAAALAFSIVLVGCDGGAIVFDEGSNARKDIDENTSGMVWSAKARIGSVANPGKIVYELKGVDAGVFLINSATGEVSFKKPADYEMPVDADKNNEYLFSVEAKADSKSAVQQVSLRVKNVTQPVVELIKPQPFENVGRGDSVDVETRVKFFDVESNTPIASAHVTLNSMPMQADGDDPNIWKSKISVPEGGVDLNIVASAPAIGTISAKENILNKPNSADVKQLFLMRGDWMMVAGEGLDVFTTFNIKSGEMSSGVNLYQHDMSDVPLMVCHPFLPECYGVAPPFNQNNFGSAYLELDEQTHILIENSFLDAQLNPSDVVIDIERQRLVFVSNSYGKLNISTAMLAPGSREGFYSSTLFSLPSVTFNNGYKHFAIHGRTNSFFFTEQRTLNGELHSFVRAFNESGVQRFEVQLGANISNLVVHEAAGLIYLADNNQTSRAELKVIDVETGVVQNLIVKESEIPHGAFTGLALDQVKNRIYIADSISDSIYQVDLTNKSISGLPYNHIIRQFGGGVDD